MSDKYETEVERFINRSLEHLERTGKTGMRLIIKTINRETGEKYRANIKFEKDEEEQH